MRDVHLPPLGDTVDEAQIVSWLRRVGEPVEVGEPLVVVETDKVQTDIPSPVAGVLQEQLVGDGETIAPGTVIARVASPADPPGNGAGAPDPGGLVGVSGTGAPTSLVGAPDLLTAAAPGVPARAVAPAALHAVPPARLRPRSASVRTPVVRRLLAEHGLDPHGMVGTGRDGRITRSDVLAAVGQPRAPESTALARAAVDAVAAPSPSLGGPAAQSSPSADPRWQPFSRIRKVTAERMLLSATTIPQVTTVVRVDYERVHRARQAHGEAFRSRTGRSLTYLPFVALSVVDAITEFPLVNATVQGAGLVVHPAVHLGIAVDINFEGLMVPVVRDAQELRLETLAGRIAHVASLARSKKLGADDLAGGTFTITNPGGFGTLVGTPLINPPEVAILSVEGIAEEPVVVRGSDGAPALAFHHIGHLSLTWDHRAIDGAYAAAFLARIRGGLENRDWSQFLS